MSNGKALKRRGKKEKSGNETVEGVDRLAHPQRAPARAAGKLSLQDGSHDRQMQELIVELVFGRLARHCFRLLVGDALFDKFLDRHLRGRRVVTSISRFRIFVRSFFFFFLSSHCALRHHVAFFAATMTQIRFHRDGFAQNLQETTKNR